MKKAITNFIGVVVCTFLFCNFFSCNKNKNPIHAEEKSFDTAIKKSIKPYIKPPASFNDTLKIHVMASVFFYPDSLQLERIKLFSDSKAFQGSMHEYFYLMRNSRMVIKKTWPKLKIVDAANCRYLNFIMDDRSRQIIDLNKVGDPYGLFVFNGHDSAVKIDMANIENEVPFILNK